MKTDRNILVAFLLNLAFSVFEFVGGIITGSVAILSDALHDMGDAASIGVSWLLERRSKRQPDEHYTYGYARYSVVGSVITTMILLLGSLLVIWKAVGRMLEPAPIDYDGMIVFAVVGVCVNAAAVFFTREGRSLNQRAVNLHMLEDVLGWAVVFIGAVVMRFTDWALLDPILSVGVAVFILVHALGGLREALGLFLEKVPAGVDIGHIRRELCGLEGVEDIHHIHVRGFDGQRVCATMHIVTDAEPVPVKRAVRALLREHGIDHATLELERPGEVCGEERCRVEEPVACQHGHHHHHHH